MPSKILSSQTGNKGLQVLFKFGGGANTIFANADNFSPFGYWIESGSGNDIVYGSDFVGDPNLDDDINFNPATDNDDTEFGDLLIGGDGNDTILGGAGNDTIFGGNEDRSDSAKGKGSLPTNLLVGDGERQSDGSYLAAVDFSNDVNAYSAFSGGNDAVTGGNASTNNIYGDAGNVTMVVDATFEGGMDSLIGGDNDDALLIDEMDLPQNNIYGDADVVSMASGSEFEGGKDDIFGGSNADNSLYGDANLVTFQANANDASFKGGMDTIYGGDAVGIGLPVNDIYGDAVRVTFSDANGESFMGGNDTLYGGNLTGPVSPLGAATNVIYGDVSQIFGNGSFDGGDDILVSGRFAKDTMYGDWGTDDSGNAVGGSDTFVFGLENGTDVIKDFRKADFDVINLFDTGLTEFDDLSGHISVIGTSTFINLGTATGLGGTNTVEVENTVVDGATILAAGDFSFADWTA